jgi:hypothetical protein
MLLLLFPVRIALARLETRQPRIRYVYLGVSVPLAAAIRSLIVTRPACQPRSGNWTPWRCSRLDWYRYPRLIWLPR